MYIINNYICTLRLTIYITKCTMNLSEYPQPYMHNVPRQGGGTQMCCVLFIVRGQIKGIGQLKVLYSLKSMVKLIFKVLGHCQS